MTTESLIITVGAPGAGKSTWAANTLPEDTLRLERDRFRECLFGSRRAYHVNTMNREHKSHLVTQTMLAAMLNWPTRSWAVTDTGLLYKSVEPFIKEANFRCIPVKLVLFPRSVAYLTRINETRPEEHRIPQEIFDDMVGLANSQDGWWLDTPYERIEVPEPCS